jgi:hypothetical protein
MESVQTNAETRLSVYINGGRGQLPEFDPTKLLDFARDFPPAVDPETGAPVLFHTTTSDYYVVEGFPATVALPFGENHGVLEELGELQDRIRAARSAISYVRAFPDRFRDEAKDVRDLKKPVDALEKKVARAAQRLAADAWQPSETDPDTLWTELEQIAAKFPVELEFEAKPEPDPLLAVCTIRSAGAPVVADIGGGRRQRGTAVITWTATGNDNQKWRFERRGDGSYLIRSVLNSLVMAVSGGVAKQGTGIVMWEYGASESQHWRLDRQDDGSYVIRTVLNGMVLDISGWNKDKGGRLQIWSQHNGWNQRWRIEAV